VQCGEFDRQITPAVDGRLVPLEAEEFQFHAEACPVCRCAFELEAFTKQFVARSLPLVPVPPPLVRRLISMLNGPGAGGPAA
jgi:hypothetical protein